MRLRTVVAAKLTDINIESALGRRCVDERKYDTVPTQLRIQIDRHAVVNEPHRALVGDSRRGDIPG